jgi:hypothetical protein
MRHQASRGSAACLRAGVLTPEIVVALVGLALLAIVPVLYRKLRARPA